MIWQGLVLVLFPGPADAALSLLAKAETFRTRKGAFAADFAFRAADKGKPLLGKIRLGDGYRAYMRIQDPALNYELFSTREGAMDIDHDARMYDEDHGPGRRPSRLSEYSSIAFPGFYFGRSLRSQLPKETVWNTDGRAVVGGVSGDVVHGKFKGTDSELDLKITVGPRGELLNVRRYSQTPMARSTYIWTFTNYRDLPESPKWFSAPLPQGYSPFELPDTGDPIQVGDSLRVPGSKATLLLLGDGTPASLAAQKWFDRFSAKETKRVLSATAASDRALISKIRPPAFPFFVRVSAAGKVTNLWMGFDASRGKEIAAALK